jgi:hypothetical protein
LHSLDYSIYPFVAEELIALGAARIAVMPGTPAEKAMQRLSKFMAHRVTVIDTTQQAAQLETLFWPIASELGGEFMWKDGLLLGFKRKRKDDNIKDFLVSCSLRQF